jgi:microcystin-dependent protein
MRRNQMNRIPKILTITAILSAVILSVQCAVFAAVPRVINYQGRLTDKSNKPLEGSYAITFRIFDVATGVAAIWSETQSGVVVQKGVFSVLLGSQTVFPDTLKFDKPYYLEIQVGSEVLSPRQQIASAGYSIMSENASSIPRGVITMWSGTIANIPTGWQLCDGTNGTPDLRNRFIIGAGATYGVAVTGGEAAHALTEAEMPSHTHTINTYMLNAIHTPTRVTCYDTGVSSGGASTTNPTGGGAAHNNLPPYFALAYIMKL